MSIPAPHRGMSFKEYKEQVARVIMLQEEDIAFPSTEMLRQYWVEGNVGPNQCAHQWIEYCLAHS